MSCLDCIPTVSTQSSPPGAVPSGLKVTCLSSPCPIVRCGEITYWFFSYIDNRLSLAVTGYGPSGTVVKGPTEKTGVRYVDTISVNTAAQTVTAVGQSGYSTTMGWQVFRLP